MTLGPHSVFINVGAGSNARRIVEVDPKSLRVNRAIRILSAFDLVGDGFGLSASVPVNKLLRITEGSEQARSFSIGTSGFLALQGSRLWVGDPRARSVA